ncbi:DUF418 domain-containing protein [Spiractinospora alimapuensis]|uniref:DUF418 domain-containing protein n=1 Tax=Spiractinospora alimapuensis TaxID=2820884 RepID=UPI001F42AED2|nr:DUF418 domain-containing protein [Spiractinospora alimapuensis]QVQ51107.1 DUF418 domain-containing protein [Spiractinospora alimapuensis]
MASEPEHTPLQATAEQTAASRPQTPAPGPTRAAERALAPDLARGFMLLLIALANTPWYLWGRAYVDTTIHPPDGSTVDRFVQAVILTGVDGRVYPMFACLFGYGMVQLLQRQVRLGESEGRARRLLVRRNVWLLVFGFVHAALLFMGDVLAAYGLAGLVVGALFLRRRDTTLLAWSGVGVGILVLLAVFSAIGAYFAVTQGLEATGDTFSTFAVSANSMATDSYLSSIVARLSFWPLLVVGQGLFGLAVPIAILLGFWAARRRVLEEPERHLTLLRWVAGVGIAIGWVGGLPHALVHVGVVSFPEEAAFVFTVLMTPTGLCAGIGYVALFGLIAHWLRSRPVGRIRAAVVAVGRRSLSCYLAQSLICAPLLTAWGLGWGSHLSSATIAAFAVGVWLVTLVGAALLDRAGRRGPAEVLLRRLTYPRSGG